MPGSGGFSTQQGCLGRAAQAAGLALPRTQAPAEDDWTRTDRLRALEVVSTRRLLDLRDRALLLMGWHLAARRSNLTWLRVGEIREVPGGLDVHFRRGKTDQEQVGRWLVVPTIGGRFCPVAAWLAWRAAMAAELGAPRPRLSGLPTHHQGWRRA